MSEDQSSVVSGLSIIAVLICVAFGLYILMPDSQQMTERLSEDGKYERALEVLEDMSPDEKKENAEFYQTTKIRLQRMLAKSGQEEMLQGLLRDAVAAYRELGQKAEELFVELIKVLQMLTDPIGAVAIIEPVVKELPVDSRTELYRTLSELALAREEPELAAEIFSKYLLDNLDDSNAVWESARLWRMAARPDNALEAIETYSMANVTNLFRQDAKLFVLRANLLRELTRANDAFTELHSALDGAEAFSVEDSELQKELSTIYVQSAVEAERGLEVLPFLEAYVERFPEEYKFLEQLAVVYTQEAQFDQATEIYQRLIAAFPDEGRYQETLAQIYEWNNQVGKAFDLYLVLASPERLKVVDRLQALHRPMYRTQEFEPVLTRILPIDGRTDLLLEHARVLTRLGRYDECIQRYRDYLGEVDSDPFALIEVADVAFESFYFKDAETFYRQAIQLLPNELRLRSRLGESLYLDSRYEEAFDYYQDYLETASKLDLQMVEVFSRLARALGRYDELSGGLERVLALKEEPESGDFLTLSQNYYYRKEFGKQAAVLEKGLEQHPDNISLAYFLGLSYSDQRQYLQAANLFESNQIYLSDARIFELYVEVLVANQDFKKALEVAEGGLERGAFESTEMKRRLASIYEGNQKYAEASELLKGLHQEDPADVATGLALVNVLNILGKRADAQKVLEPYLENPDANVLKVAASLAAAAGEFKRAEEYQLAYLEAAEEPSFYDYGFLGDIRLELGEPIRAKGDYETSLLRMLNEVITPEQLASN